MKELKDYEQILKRSSKELSTVQNRVIVKKRVPKSEKWHFKAIYKIKKIIISLLNPLGNLPFSILFVIFLIVMVLTVLVANHLRMRYFSNVLAKAYPEISTVPATAEGKPLYPSIIDKILAEFNAINNVGYLIVFMVFFIEFLKGIEYGFIPRKPQVWRL